MIVDVRDLNGHKLYDKVRSVLDLGGKGVRRLYVYVNARENPRKVKSFLEMSGFSARIFNRKDGYLVKAV
ncbi:MAG: hypothetical protein M0Z58_02800 [Nitrospiraceae bacterium]|nr:hypothetical protein [Nitrospiraceae bacterium]